MRLRQDVATLVQPSNKRVQDGGQVQTSDVTLQFK
jgi:hypothetical protein